MSNNNRNDNPNSNYIYPQPYIDPMVYLNPYYSNATGYQNNSQGYVGYPNFYNECIDYSQFNENPNNNYINSDSINDNNYGAKEYTNIPNEEDFNIPSIPYFLPVNMSPQQGMPNMILPNMYYESLPPNMVNQNMQGIQKQNQQNITSQGIPNFQNQNTGNQATPYGIPIYPNMMGGYIPIQKPPMYPAGMYPNMYPEIMPNMMYANYPFVNMGPGMPSVNMEEFDEEEM